MALSYEDVLRRYEAAAERARRATEQRYQQLLELYGRGIQRYQPGGVFEQRALQQIERQKKIGVGKELQQMISSGLYGTTVAAGAARRWEEQVGMPARLTLEDIMLQRLTEAERGLAGVIERREDIPPSPELYAALLQRATAVPGRVVVPSYSRVMPSYSQRPSSYATGGPINYMEKIFGKDYRRRLLGLR